MLTLRRSVVAVLLAIACVLIGSTTSTAQPINVRGYLDIGSPSGDGPLLLIGDNGFSFSSGLNFRDWIIGPHQCIDSPSSCEPGQSLSLNGSANSESGTLRYQGVTYRATGGIDSPAVVSVFFNGSVTLPPLAPTAVVTASFTFSGGFTFKKPNGEEPTVLFNDVHGTATVFLTSPSSPFFPNTWRVARVLYQIDQTPFPGRWTHGDIGDVGQPGSAAFANGQFQVSGAGGNIWGTADAFHYLFTQPDHGPSGVVARVDSFSAGQPFAKAGVMVRQTLDASSPHVVLDVRPDGGVEFMTRSVDGGETTFIAGATASFPVWLRLSVVAGNVVGLMSSDAVSWKMVGSTPFPGGLEGIVVTSHDPSVTAQATFEGLAAGPEWPWYQTDIGDVALAGNAEVVQQETLVSGSGADIWGTADAFHFLYSILPTGNRLVARVVGEQGTDPFAKAGLVMGGLAADAVRVILDARPDGNIEFMARNSAGTPMAFIAAANASFPVWLRLTSTGDVFTGEMSTDGAAWTTVGSVTITPSAGVVPGLAVTSHNPGTLNIAQFDNIRFESAGSAGQNLLVNGGFEDSVVPDTGPGWVSDPIRQIAAKSETNQPHSGSKNGACWATTAEDCGIFQEVVAPTTGTYTLTLFANADRRGGLVGANVNGTAAVSQGVDLVAFGNYGSIYNLSFHAAAGDTIRVWMYSPASPGYVVIDDVSLSLH